MNTALPNSLCDPRHPLHAAWSALLALLQTQIPAGSGLAGEDCRRAAAQLLMEVVLRGLGTVDCVRVDAGGNLHVRCRRGDGQRWLCLDGRLATAYRVEEVSAALDEACRAWNIVMSASGLPASAQRPR